MVGEQCSRCLRYRWDDTCDAFPYGIPEPITKGEWDHTEEVPDDRGLRFWPSATGERLVKADEPGPTGLLEYIDGLMDREGKAYRRAQAALKRRGYVDADFGPGGKLYGLSVNQLLEILRS